ncbi:MAG: hypothetical protein WD738_20985 [Pirellulales bacterium]
MSRFVRMVDMSRFALLLVVALTAGPAAAQDAATLPMPQSGQSRQRIVVLQDGGVLAGRISQEGESYVVTRGGGQFRIAAAKVMLVCDTLEEAYNHRRQHLTHPTAEAHLAVAEWCLRYGLVAQAGRELTDARALDARHARLALLERRLALASQEPRKAAAAEVSAKASVSPIDTSQQNRPAVIDVPTNVVERFTRRVQPILVNNCTAAGCHQQGGAQPFQLDRALLHGLANRRSTTANLSATLALVDRARPQLSPLLTVPRQPHGGMESPVFGPRQEQAFEHLVDWVSLVTQSDSSKPADATSSDGDQVDETADSSKAERNMDQALDPKMDGVIKTSYEQPVSAYEPTAPRLRFGAQLEKWQPRDEFDAEIFNRRYRSQADDSR